MRVTNAVAEAMRTPLPVGREVLGCATGRRDLMQLFAYGSGVLRQDKRARPEPGGLCYFLRDVEAWGSETRRQDRRAELTGMASTSAHATRVRMQGRLPRKLTPRRSRRRTGWISLTSRTCNSTVGCGVPATVASRVPFAARARSGKRPASADLKGGASDLEPKTGQSRQSKQEPGRSSSQRVPDAFLPLGDLVQVTLEKPLQLVEIGVGKGRDLERRGVVVVPGLRRLHAHLVGKGERRAQGVDGGIAPLPGPATHQGEHGVLVEQRLVMQDHVPLGLALEGVEPAASGAPYAQGVVKADRQPRAQRRQPTPVVEQILRANHRWPRA